MKFVSKFVLVAALSLSSFAFAQEEGTADTGGGGVRAPGALLDASEKTERSMLLSIHGYLPYHGFGFGYFPIGGGASFYIPLVKNGFISKLNDEFGIDFGVDAVVGIANPVSFSLHIPVGVQWKFHILSNLEVYAKAGIQIDLWFYYFGRAFAPWPLYPVGVVGAHYFFSKGFGLKLEAGSTGVRFGVVLAF